MEHHRLLSSNLLFRGFIALLMAGIILAAGGAAVAATISGGVSAVSPDTALPGDTVTVEITLNESAQPGPPPADVTPDSVWIGTVAAASFSRDSSTGLVTATFSVPTTESYGTKDVDVVFSPQTEEMHYVLTGGFTVSSGTTASTVYVDAGSTAASPDGLSWATAYPTLTQGLNGASGYGATAIWVAAGTYYPTTEGDRTASFELLSGVSIYGGFSGSESQLSLRNSDPLTNNTVLSGDIGISGTAGDNVYHVVTGANGAVLDGFTISGGYADGEKSDRLGGGMLNLGTYSSTGSPMAPTVRNCRFMNNYAESGGGMYNYFSSTAIDTCTFSSNSAQYGGAVLFRVGSDASVSDCTFSNNSASWRGGAVYIDYGADPTLSNCTFKDNTTDGNGGGAYVDDRASQLGGTYPTFSGCTFTGNKAAYRGGGFAAYNSSCNPTLTNCTFNTNTATVGGGAIALNQSVVLTLSGETYSGNTGGTGNADLDYDSTCTVQ